MLTLALCFLQAGRASISFMQLSQVSPAVMRRSIEIEQLSATAQREGLVKKIWETVQVPRPKKRASS